MNLVIKQEGGGGGGGGGNLIPLLNHGAATVLVFKGLQCIFEYLHIFSETSGQCGIWLWSFELVVFF